MPDHHDGFTEGQTAAGDALRLHLMSAHANLAALHHTDAEALDEHAHEHTGPGTIRNHDEDSTDWSEAKIHLMVLDQQHDRFLTTDQYDELVQAWEAHQRRAGTIAPVGIYQHASRYTITALPQGDPWRRHYLIHVVEVAAGVWSVERAGWYATPAGEWIPRTTSIPRRHLMPVEEALMLAHRLAPDVEGVDDKTARDVLNLSKTGRR